MRQAFSIQGFQTFDKARILLRAGERAKKERTTVNIMSGNKVFATVHKNGKLQFN